MSDGAKLWHAARAGNDAKVKRLLKAKADVNSIVTNETGSYRASALQIACHHGHVGAARLLLKAKATVDLPGAFKGGMTVKEINAAFGERAGELKKPAKRLGLIDMGLIHLFMM